MSPYLLLGINIILGVVGQFLIKFGVNRVGGLEELGLVKFLMTSFLSPFILAGLALYGFSAVLWVILLSKLDLSVAYPALSIGYILVLLISALFLGEQISAVRFVGVLLIMAGIVFLFRS
jgi:multidrug transporter EmrE-like cation transporter